MAPPASPASCRVCGLDDLPSGVVRRVMAFLVPWQKVEMWRYGNDVSEAPWAVQEEKLYIVRTLDVDSRAFICPGSMLKAHAVKLKKRLRQEHSVADLMYTPLIGRFLSRKISGSKQESGPLVKYDIDESGEKLEEFALEFDFPLKLKGIWRDEKFFCVEDPWAHPKSRVNTTGRTPYAFEHAVDLGLPYANDDTLSIQNPDCVDRNDLGRQPVRPAYWQVVPPWSKKVRNDTRYKLFCYFNEHVSDMVNWEKDDSFEKTPYISGYWLYDKHRIPTYDERSITYALKTC